MQPVGNQVVEVVRQVPIPVIETREVQYPKREVHYIERVVEVPQVLFEETVVGHSVPANVELVQRIVEVPMVQLQERIVEVPKIEIREVVKQVPVPDVQYVDKVVMKDPGVQIQYVDTTVEVPQVLLQEAPVEIPEIVEVETITEVPRPELQHVSKEVPNDPGQFELILQKPRMRTEFVDKLVDIPGVQIKERVVEVPLVTVIERVTEVSAGEEKRLRVGGGSEEDPDVGQPRHEQDVDHTLRYLVFGAPGSGKSTLLNCIAEKVLFKAGPSQDGTGVTRVYEQKEHAGRKFADVPGLNDPELRKEAATAMTSALREAGTCKIIFLCREEHGRVQYDDRVTIKLVLDAVPAIREAYGVIINQCGSYVMGHYKDPEYRKSLLNSLLKGLPFKSPVIYFNPRDDILDDAHDKFVKLSNELQSFVEDLVPTVQLKPQHVGVVSGADFEDLQEQLRQAEDLGREQQELLLYQNSQLRKRLQDLKEKEREAQNKCNSCTVIVFAFLLAALSTPAWLTLLDIGDLSRHILYTIVFPGGATMRLQTYLFPYLLVFVIYKFHASLSKWCKSAELEFDDVKIGGRSFEIGIGTLKVWHVYIVGQVMDCLSDSLACRALLLDPAVESIPKIVWSLTTLASVAIPALYVRTNVTFANALLYQLTLEDMEQAFVSLWEIQRKLTAGTHVPISVACSCIVALLGVAEGIALVRSRLRQDHRVHGAAVYQPIPQTDAA